MLVELMQLVCNLNISKSTSTGKRPLITDFKKVGVLGANVRICVQCCVCEDNTHETNVRKRQMSKFFDAKVSRLLSFKEKRSLKL